MTQMRLSYFFQNGGLESDERVKALLDELGKSGFQLSRIREAADLDVGSSMLLSLGGDGTFLAAAALAAPLSVPVLGVNFGRLGFLSESAASLAVQALSSGDYRIEEREMLCARVGGASYFALNEVSLTRTGSAMLGVDVRLDSVQFPTFWGDGVLVATSSGSTAYSLSVGGPICTPDLQAHIITPIAPHNLNLRPLVVPSAKKIELCATSRGEKVKLSADNFSVCIPEGAKVEVTGSEHPLRKVVLNDSNFINALECKLHWGDDIRNR